jgi:hypothetical protein
MSHDLNEKPNEEPDDLETSVDELVTVPQAHELEK